MTFPIYGKRTNLQHPQPDMYHLYLSFGWVSAWSLYRLSTLKCVVRYTLHSKSTHPRSIRCSTNISREFVIKPRDTQAQAVMTNAQMSPALHPGIDERTLRPSTSGKRSHSQHIIQHTHTRHANSLNSEKKCWKPVCQFRENLSSHTERKDTE